MQPLVSLAALERALSPERLRAYRCLDDRDETDGLARYIWNAALVTAIQPLLHVIEIAFRNELSRAARTITASRSYRYDSIPSWLDAVPSMLLEHEREKVVHAKTYLGDDPRSQTEGHLIAKLDFGFWIALCREPYSDRRADGPRLWNRALTMVCAKRPAQVATRAEIYHRFDDVRKYRNRIAHHEPIWDRDFMSRFAFLIDTLRWMSPKMADAVEQTSAARPLFAAGPAAYRPYAETFLGTGAGLEATLPYRLRALDPSRRAVVAAIVQAMTEAPEDNPRRILAEISALL